MRTPGSFIEGSSLQIRELTGRKRSIVLSGRAGPFRGPKWGVQQRTKRTTYPGQPEATLQLFGIDFDVPTQLTGMWRDRYLGEKGLVTVEGMPPPQTAEALKNIFEDLVRAGSTLEVIWGFYVRRGVLKRFEGKPDRVEDVGWEAEFEWIGDGQTTAPRPKFPDAPNVQKVKASMAALSDQAVFDPVDVLVAFEAKVFSQIAELEDRVQDLLGAVQVLANAVTLPARVVSSVQQAATAIAFTCGALIETVLSTPYVYLQVIDDLASVLRAEAWRRDMASYAQHLRGDTLSVAAAFERRAEPDPVRIVKAGPHGNLRKIAADEYGRADAWQLIADANGFDGPYVEPGTEVWVPPAPGPVGVT